MKIPPAIHRWSISPRRAIALQRELAPRVISTGSIEKIRYVCGADAAFCDEGRTCVAGVVIWDVENKQITEQRWAKRPVRFPYVPGLLTFREAPAILAAIRILRTEPDLFMFDGQGFAHPRRFGLASHLGVLLDHPALGCAKSLLIGEVTPPENELGSIGLIRDSGTVIGAAVRTRAKVKPVYISIGHRVSLETAIKLLLRCCIGYRLPEPTRRADQWVAQVKRMV